MQQISSQKPSEKLITGNHIFREMPHGKLEFVGNFEALYQSEQDPWSQSGSGRDMSPYYAWSRARLIEQLKVINPISVLEVGCGLGYVTQMIEQALPSSSVVGLDISPTAVEKARSQFPHSTFQQGNICSKAFDVTTQYDAVILSQVLWYIVESLPTTLANCSKLLNSGGQLIFTQAFLKSPQRYAANIINGFDGLMAYLEKSTESSLEVSYSSYDDQQAYQHHDGLIVLKASNLGS